MSSTYEIVGAEIGLGITVQDKEVEGTCKYILISVAGFWTAFASHISCLALHELCLLHIKNMYKLLSS